MHDTSMHESNTSTVSSLSPHTLVEMHMSWVTVSMVGTAILTPPPPDREEQLEGAADEQLGAPAQPPTGVCADGAAELNDWMSLMWLTRSPKASAHSAMSLHLDLWLALLSHHACICVGVSWGGSVCVRAHATTGVQVHHGGTGTAGRDEGGDRQGVRVRFTSSRTCQEEDGRVVKAEVGHTGRDGRCAGREVKAVKRTACG